MAIFSTNQVNQFYVVKYIGTGKHLAKNAAVGTILPIARPDGTIQFEYMSPGGVITSDRINPKNVKYKSYAKGANHPGHIFKSVKLTLNSEVISEGNVLPGKSYVTRIVFESFIGNTMRDNHWLHGEVRGEKNMAPSVFYKRMACSLARNMAREASTLVDVYLSADGTALSKQVTPADATTSKEAALIADSTEYSAIIIKEHAQEPKLLGCGEEDPVVFDVEPLAIDVDGVDVTWGTAETIAPASIVLFDGTNHAAATAMPNGVMIAEMEYFFMGERGDQERMQGYPNIVPTKYLIENRYGTYSVLNIHFYFEDEGTSVQHSDKDITLVGDDTTLIKLVTGAGPIKNLTWAQVGTTGDYK